MPILFFFLSCLALAAQEIASQSSLEVRLRSFWEISPSELAVRAWQWPKEERLMLAREFKAYLHQGKFGNPEGRQPTAILIALGDRETTEMDVRKMVARPDGHGGFERIGGPIVIEYLVPYAFSQEPYVENRRLDVHTAPFSYRVTYNIFRILSICPAFDSEVTNWARRAKAPDPQLQRAELQRWWEENRVHFEREEYKLVKPGRPIPTALEVIDANRRKAGLPSLEETRPKVPKPVLRPTKEQSPPNSVRQSFPPNGQRKASFTLWLVGGLVVIAIFVLVSNRRTS